MFIEEIRELGYETEDELLEELCGCNEDFSLEDFWDSYDPS